MLMVDRGERGINRERGRRTMCAGRGNAIEMKLEAISKTQWLAFYEFSSDKQRDATRDSRAEVEPNFWLLVWRRDQSECTTIEGGLTGGMKEGADYSCQPTAPPSTVVLAATLSTFVHAARHWQYIPLYPSLSISHLLMC